MLNLVSIIATKDENVKKYCRRIKNTIYRRIPPVFRYKHYLEELVGPTGYWEPLQAYQFEFLKTVGLKPQHSLLDIGCGPLQGGIKFIDYLEPGKYTGIDLRQKAIVAAYKQVIRYNLSGKNPRLIMSDSFGRDELNDGCFDYIWISQLLYHLSPERIEALFLQISSQMGDTSVFYGDIIDYDMPQLASGTSWQEFNFYQHQPEDLQAMAKQSGLAIDIVGQTGDFGYPKELWLSNNYMLKIYKEPCQLSDFAPAKCACRNL